MHTLYRAFNYRRIRLDADTTKELAPVLCRDGRTSLVRWLGFISRQEARKRLDAKPVRLKISRVDGLDLSDNQWVLGCLVAQGVYAVVDSQVVILDVPQDSG